MEEQLDLVSKLSLSEMAFRRVVVKLWHESLLSDMVRKGLEWSSDFYFWREKTEDVKRKVSNLVLPELLKKRMMDLVAPICTEMQRWKSFHKCLLNSSHEDFDMNICEQLCWTCTGAIDYCKTAEEILRLEMLNIEKRYRLACWYCLEDYISMLWVELPENYKSRFNDDVYPLPENVVHLEYYWASVLKGEEFKLNDILPIEFVNMSSTYQSYLKYSACELNKAAIEYFFQKLTYEERSSALFRISFDAFGRSKSFYLLPIGRQKFRSDALLFLLSLMNREEQMQIFKLHPFKCLMCFLDWPWQDLFLDIADKIWEFLPEIHYDFVVYKLFDNMFALGRGYYFPELFQNFFMRSPINFKKCYVQREIRCGITFLGKFLNAEDVETIKVVLGNLESGDRMRLLSQGRFFSLLIFLMQIGKWHLIQLCIGAATLSTEERMILKRTYMGFDTMDWTDSKFKRLLEVLDGTIASTDSTKCSENETLTQAKRLSSDEEGNSDLTKKLKRH